MGELFYSTLKGFWLDAGESISALLKANKIVARKGANKKYL